MNRNELGAAQRRIWAYQWTGGPPRPFNYWGYDVNPVWDDGFHQWGIWLFGLWIPIFGIGVS
jgi:hypothetical protein